MNEYAARMKPIEVRRGYYAEMERDGKTIGPEMLTKVKGLNGQIGWLGGNGRPDLAAAHSIIAGGYKDEKATIVKDCNDCVTRAHNHKINLKVWSIPVKDLRLVAFCDSSFDPKGERHQQGWIIGFTTRELNNNQRAPVSIALWKSRKLPNKAGSPQLVETYAAQSALADANWVRCLLYSSLYNDFDKLDQRPRHFPKIDTSPSVLRTDRQDVIDPEVSLLSDSKGLYDANNNEIPQDDRKAAVVMPIIGEILSRILGRVRWTPHNFNPSDGLTKFRGAHMEPMMDLMKTGFYHLRTEDANLMSRAEEKENTGHVSRQ